MCHVPMGPLTWCALPPGLVGSQLVHESQIRWSSCGSGTESPHAQSLVKINEHFPNCLILGPSSRRQAPVESESFPEVCSPMPDASCGDLSEKLDKFKGSREAGASCCDFSRPALHRGGQRYQRCNRAITCAEVHTDSSWTTTPPPSHSGFSPDVQKWKLESITREAKSCEARSWTAPQVYNGALAPPGQGRRRNFVLEIQHHQGSQLLAAMMARWPSFSRFGSSQLPRNHLHVAVLTLALQVTYMRP